MSAKRRWGSLGALVVVSLLAIGEAAHARQARAAGAAATLGSVSRPRSIPTGAAPLRGLAIAQHTTRSPVDIDENGLPGDPELRRKQQKERNDQRDKQLKENAARLLQLAQGLKDAVDQTNSHVMSLQVIDKAEQIGKLAKKIKESMRDAR